MTEIAACFEGTAWSLLRTLILLWIVGCGFVGIVILLVPKEPRS